MNRPDTYMVVCGRMSRIFGWQEQKYYYRWYWQADLRSWFMHHVFGLSCNTYLHNEMVGKVKARPPVFK